MKKLFSLLLGGFLLFGAATLGLQSGTASAAVRHDKNRKHHHKHHHHHHHHNRKNKLSY
jgi:Spy/CpxP family protein refolding chaperone